MKENQSHEARRRAFIREHHPDRGGDPGAFIAGMRVLDAEGGLGSGAPPQGGGYPAAALARPQGGRDGAAGSLWAKALTRAFTRPRQRSFLRAACRATAVTAES